jgi:hypothetical protein
MGLISGINAGAALSQTIFGNAGKSFPDTNRIPMVFTSTKRLRQLSSGFSTVDTQLKSESETAESQLRQLFQAGATESIELPVIEMMINPNSITWKQPKRIVKRDTQEGSIFFHFTNNKRQNNDILTLDFRGNTGNINPRGDLDSESSALSTVSGVRTGALKKAHIWHNLWALTREEILLDDYTVNEFIIMYNSVIIPTQVMLIGFYSNVMDWTDSADKPFSKDYAMSFTVQETVPPLEELLGDIQGFEFNPDTAFVQT